MKRFLIDQTLFLVIGLGIFLLIPLFCSSVFTLFFRIVVVLCWGYLCRRILLLPIDFVLGKFSQTVYFSTQCGIEKLEFFKGTYYLVWKFCLEDNQPLRVFVPIAITKEDIQKILSPPKNVKLKITYYKLSKILVHWNVS